MKYLFIFLTVILFSCGSINPHTGVSYGDNNTQTAAERYGMDCAYSNMKLKNKSEYVQTITIDSSHYEVQPAKQFLFFSFAGKSVFPIYPGEHHFYDNHGDHLKMETEGCMQYKQVFISKLPEPVISYVPDSHPVKNTQKVIGR